VADRVISILPHRYEGVEQKALDFIRGSSFAPLAERIEHAYF